MYAAACISNAVAWAAQMTTNNHPIFDALGAQKTLELVASADA